MPSRPARSLAASLVPTTASWRRTVPLLVAAATLVPTASAAGAAFAPPRAISPAGQLADGPAAVVAPTGRTVVLWRQADRHGRRDRTVAADGPSPDQLGPARPVPAGRRATATLSTRTLLAAPDGGVVACFGDDARFARRPTAVLGCAFAPPGRRFGPLRVVARRPARERPALRAAILPDGRVAVVVTRRIPGRHDEVRALTLDAGGRITDRQRLGLVRRNAEVALATTDDGVTAVAWTAPVRRGGALGARPLLRLRAAAGGPFTDPGPVLPVRTVGNDVEDGGDGVRLVGGPRLAIRFRPGGTEGPLQTVVRTPDGRFGAPLAAPTPPPAPATAGPVIDTPLVLPAAGAPLQVTNAVDSGITDCSDYRVGVVGVGPLAPAGGAAAPAERLSTPGQIALDPRLAALGDGSVVAAWHDAAGADGRQRVEVAVRSAGAPAFAPAQVLPTLASEPAVLAAGGHDAVLVWTSGRRPFGPSRVVVSALRQAPPFAAPAPRPRHPRAPCS